MKKNMHTNTHTNVWKKRVQMYEKNKCMEKKRVQTRIQMYEKKQAYDKNAYKIAYKCMKKTRIQMYEKNMHTNTHTNVLKKQMY